MQKSAGLVHAVAVLGFAAFVLGAVAGSKSKAQVLESSDGEQHCVYRRNPALGYGVAGALLVLMAVVVATAASGDRPASTGRRRVDAAAFKRRLIIAWVAVLMTTAFFLYGAAMKRGLTSSRTSNYFCAELKSETFYLASLLSLVATGFAIAAYVVSFPRTDEPAPGVEMGQPQGAQPYPPPPVANLAPPQFEHDGYGARQPAA